MPRRPSHVPDTTPQPSSLGEASASCAAETGDGIDNHLRQRGMDRCRPARRDLPAVSADTNSSASYGTATPTVYTKNQT